MLTGIRSLLIGACVLGAATLLTAQQPPKQEPAKTTVPAIRIVPAVQQPGAIPARPGGENSSHEQVADIKIQSADGKMRLQTIGIDNEGRVLGLVAPPRGYGAPIKDATSEIHVYSPDGKPVKTFNVDFHGHSVNTGPDGSIYVAGDGKVAKFDRDGKQLARIELPHIAALLKDTGEMRKAAEEQIKTQKANFQRSVDSITEQKKKLEAKKEEDRSAQEKRLLQQYEQILKSYEQTAKYYDNLKPDAIIEQMTGRLRIINGIAISKQDVFIVCGETKGYGFAVWRMDHEFKNAKQVIGNVVGCCGQMDIQCCGTDVLLAENTKHSYAKYDRDGKELARAGKRGAETEPGCFGGCCNPMNLRCSSGSTDVYTAESEGIIKRFSQTGEFIGTVGHVALTGGCKNVGVAVNADGSKVYFCDQPGSRVIVLGKKAKKSE